MEFKKKLINKVEKIQDRELVNNVLCVVEAIKQSDKNLAISYLKAAAARDVECPEIYNLLGILYESIGDNIKASRYYRVAYYMDQTFKPAQENLDRVTNWAYRGFHNVSWGLERVGGKA